MKRINHNFAQRWSLTVCLLLSCFCVAQAGEPLWSHKGSSEIKWQKVTDIGTLLIGNDGGITSMDPETGKPMWARTDLKGVTEDRVEEIAGRPLLLVSINDGTFQKSTRLFALDILSGKTLWESDKLKGATVEIYPVYEKEIVVIFTVQNNSANRDKPDLVAFEMSQGKLLWESEVPDKVDLHGIERGGKFFPRFDLSGHQPPIHDADSLYVTYSGLHRFDLNTGKLVWKTAYDVTEGNIKRGNAQAIIDGDTIYTSAKGQLRAIDKATGSIKWTSKDFGAAVAEMTIRGNVIYGRMGGHFYDYGKREWVLKKPLGVVSVNKTGGATLNSYTKLKDSITNMAFATNQNLLIISDKDELIGLATDDGGSLKESFKQKLEFKRKLGAGDVIGTAAKIGFGGLRALASKGGDRDDPPVAVSIRENGLAVVRGKQHVLAFDPRSKNIAWSVEFPAPGINNWQRYSMLAITAFSYSMNAAQARTATSSFDQNRWAERASDDVAAYSRYVSKRYSATTESGQYIYVLTNVEEGKDKGAGLIAINLNTGESRGQVMLKDKEPEYQVDEITGRLFNLKGNSLNAYLIR